MEQLNQWVLDLQKSFVEINYVQFALNLLLTALLSAGIGLFYVRFGNAAGNRKKFALTFLPLALTTMLIIFIVKGSVALSLGLVGALSIVRFRAAIKDPEELVYLFLNIGVGLAAGAGEILTAGGSVIFILAILLVQSAARGKKWGRSEARMHLHISTSVKDIAAISGILTATLPFVELRRADDTGARMEFSFLVQPRTLADLDTVRNELQKKDAGLTLSFIEQRDPAA